MSDNQFQHPYQHVTDNGQTTPEHPAGFRMRTVVFGLAAVAVSAMILVNTLTTREIPRELVIIGSLLAAGVLLIGGGIAGAYREQRAARSRG